MATRSRTQTSSGRPDERAASVGGSARRKILGDIADLKNLLRNPFSFLFARSSQEELVAAYLIREHSRGRSVGEILDDRYVQNRLTPQQQTRLLDRPEVIRALGQDTAEAAKQQLPAEGS